MKFLLVLLLGVWCVAAKTSYEGHKIYRVLPTTEEQKDLLSRLEDGDNTLDFWSGVNRINIPIDIRVAPEDERHFLNMMYKNGMTPEVFIEDVQKLIDAENVATYNSRAGMTWTQYYNLAGINTWLDEIAAANPGKVSVINGGSTYEKRQIKGVKISFGTGKRAVFLEGGIHAREWISPATMTYVINELLNSQNPSFQKIARSFDWYVFPVTNPDGFSFTHTNTRLWRKTRSVYGNCIGADPNRNWNAHWGEAGTSTSPCSDTYGGPRAFSEIETSSLSQFISTIGNKLDVYLAFHSYAQMMLMPYGHTTQHLDNHDDVLKIGKAAVAALANRYNTKYTVGNIAETIYPASGGSMDWVKQNYKTKIAFTYELRDKGTYGFVLPPNQIIPNCLEVMDSIIAIFNEGARMGLITLS